MGFAPKVRRWALSVGVAVPLLLMAACGQVSTPPTAPPAETKPAAPPAAAKPAAPPAAAKPAAAPTATKPAEAPKVPQKLSIGYPVVSANALPLVYAQESGIFAREGLDVTLKLIRGAPTIIATVVSKDLDAAYVGFDALAGAAAQGDQSLRYVAELISEFPQHLVVPPSISSISELRGKSMAGSGAGSLSDILFLAGLSKGGIADPVKETKYLNVAGGSARWGMLQQGQVAGAALNPPFTQQAEAAGYKLLQYQGDILSPWAGQGIITRTDLISSRSQTVQALVTSLKKAVVEMQQNKARAVEVAAKFLELDPPMAEKVYVAMIPLFLADAKPNPAGIQAVLDSRTEGRKKIEASAVLDDRFLK